MGSVPHFPRISHLVLKHAEVRAGVLDEVPSYQEKYY